MGLFRAARNGGASAMPAKALSLGGEGEAEAIPCGARIGVKSPLIETHSAKCFFERLMNLLT